MDAKTSKLVRGQFTDGISALEMGGFEFKGLTKEGVAFSDGVDTIVVKTVVKKEDFDLESAIEEKTEADTKLAERAAKAKSKATVTPKAKAKGAASAEVDSVLDNMLG